MSKVTFLTPTGRIVQGSMSNPNTTEYKSNVPLTYKTGPNAGQPRVEYYFGLAIPKTDPGLQELMQKLGQAAAEGWPGGENGVAGFSWKIIDGDGVDGGGKAYADREGHAGCTILKFTGSFAPKCFRAAGVGQWLEVQPETIKTGDYVRVSGSAEGNKNAANPGIYMNYDQIEHMAAGVEIVSGPTAAEAFATPAAALPAGATALPAATVPAANGAAPAGTVVPGAATPAADTPASSVPPQNTAFIAPPG